MSLEEFFKDVKEAEAYTKEYLNDILNKSIYEYYLIEKQTEQIEINRKINLFKNTKIKDILIKVDTNNNQNFEVYNKDNTQQNQYEFLKIEQIEQFQPFIIEYITKNCHPNYLSKNYLSYSIYSHIDEILRGFCGQDGIKYLCKNIIQNEINYELKSMIEAQENQIKNLKEVIIRNNNEELSTKIDNQEEIIEYFKSMIEAQENQIKDLIFNNHNFRITDELQEKKINNFFQVIRNENQALLIKIDNQEEIIEDLALNKEQQEKKIDNQEEIIKDLIIYNQSLAFKNDKLEKKIWEYAGQEFNVNSPKQLGEILFDKMALTVKGLKKTTGGARSTREGKRAPVRERLQGASGRHLIRYARRGRIVKSDREFRQPY
jgi:DNA polymerase I-like protein with 3'-5' exonuclease and polymerase domains